MARTLPWLVASKSATATKSKTVKTTTTRPTKPIQHEQATGPPRHSRGSSTSSTTSSSTTSSPNSRLCPRNDVNNEPFSSSPPTALPPSPPSQSPMRPNSNDNTWIMVEDEFLAVANSYTHHLHQAQYRRLKAELGLKDSHTRPSIRPLRHSPLDGGDIIVAAAPAATDSPPWNDESGPTKRIKVKRKNKQLTNLLRDARPPQRRRPLLTAAPGTPSSKPAVLSSPVTAATEAQASEDPNMNREARAVTETGLDEKDAETKRRKAEERFTEMETKRRKLEEAWSKKKTKRRESERRAQVSLDEVPVFLV